MLPCRDEVGKPGVKITQEHMYCAISSIQHIDMHNNILIYIYCIYCIIYSIIFVYTIVFILQYYRCVCPCVSWQICFQRNKHSPGRICGPFVVGFLQTPPRQNGLGMATINESFCQLVQCVTVSLVSCKYKPHVQSKAISVALLQ